MREKTAFSTYVCMYSPVTELDQIFFDMQLIQPIHVCSYVHCQKNYQRRNFWSQIGKETGVCCQLPSFIGTNALVANAHFFPFTQRFICHFKNRNLVNFFCMIAISFPFSILVSRWAGSETVIFQCTDQRFCLNVFVFAELYCSVNAYIFN